MNRRNQGGKKTKLIQCTTGIIKDNRNTPPTNSDARGNEKPAQNRTEVKIQE